MDDSTHGVKPVPPLSMVEVLLYRVVLVKLPVVLAVKKRERAT